MASQPLAVSTDQFPAIEQTILSLLRRSEQILCVSHISPDGDAVGSLLGMGWILRALGKDPVLALQDQPSDAFAFVPGYREIVGEEAVTDKYDLIVCLDASSPDRMGRVYRKSHAGIPLLVIDHHVTNTYFGTHNWVDPACAATCQMLVFLADALEIPLNANLAQALLTGLVTDTLCFRTSNTDARVLQAAMRLVESGGNLNQIVEQVLRRQPFSLVKLWGEVLSNVVLEEGVIWGTISRAQRQSAGIDHDNGGGLSNHLVTVAEADISATFNELTDDAGEDVVECSFRAKPRFDVSGVAFSFGGGGHPAAAGCMVPGTLTDVSRRVVDALKEARRNQLRAAAEGTLAREMMDEEQVARG